MLGFFPLTGTAIADDGPVTAVGVSGVQGTASSGSVLVFTDQVIAVSGVETTGAVAGVTVIPGFGIVVPVTGVEATGGVDSVTVIPGFGPVVPVTGIEAAGAVGIPLVSGDANVSVTGLGATVSVGEVTQRTTAVIPITFTPEAVTAVGSVSVTGTAVVNLTGVVGSGQAGSVVVWGRIIPDEDTLWTEIIAA